MSEMKTDRPLEVTCGGTPVPQADGDKKVAGAPLLRDRILEAGTEKMRQVGIRSVSIDDICRQLGISKKTFYVYFASKDQLITEGLMLHERKLEKNILAEVEGKSTLEILREWMSIAHASGKDMEQPPPLLYDLQKYYPALYMLHKEHLYDMMYRNLMHLVRKGQEEGVLRADLNANLTAQLLAYSHRIIVEQVQQYPQRRDDIIDIAKQGMEIAGRGVLTEQGLAALRALEDSEKKTLNQSTYTKKKN